MRLARPSRRDALLAAGLGALAAAEVLTDADFRADAAALLPLAAAMAVATAWRVRYPLPSMLVLAVLGTAVEAVVPASLDEPMSTLLMILVGVYSIGAHARGVTLAAGVGVVVATMVVAMAEDESGVTGIGDVLFYAFFLIGPLAAGYAMRRRREREEVITAEGTERARTAVAEERARIARELHDVVAHGISVMVLQARGGRRALATDPAAAREAFDAIETAGRESLAEMRRLLDMLRRDDDELALAPQPGLRHLDTLVAQVSDAGLPVTLEVVGEPTQLPPGVDLAAFRIVQEALTNALRHAGPATAHVRVAYEADGVAIDVADTGRGTPASANGGHGLAVMRERVRLYGGDVRTRAAAGGGFEVHARLPLDGSGS